MVFRGKVVFLTAQEAADKEEKRGNRAGVHDTHMRKSRNTEGICDREGTGSSRQATETLATEQQPEMGMSWTAGNCRGKPTKQHRPGAFDGNFNLSTSTQPQRRCDSSGRKSGDLELDIDRRNNSRGRRSGDLEVNIDHTLVRKQQQEERRQGPTMPTTRRLQPMDLQELGGRFEMHFGAFSDSQCQEGLRLWDRVTSNLDTIQEWTLERMIDVDTVRLDFGAQLLAEEMEELRIVPLVSGWSGYATMAGLVERLQTSLGLLEEVLWMWEVGIPTGMHHCSLMGEIFSGSSESSMMSSFPASSAWAPSVPTSCPPKKLQQVGKKYEAIS